MAWMFDHHQIFQNAELFFSFFLIFEKDFDFRENFCSLSSSILKRKLAEISFVAMSRSIEVQNEVLLYRSWQSLWGKVEKAWHLSAWGYWEGNFSLHPRVGFRFCIRLTFEDLLRRSSHCSFTYRKSILLLIRKPRCMSLAGCDWASSPALDLVFVYSKLAPLKKRQYFKKTIQQPPRKENV